MLAEILPEQLFAYFLVFLRLGAAMMLLPGFGDAYVPPRVRLLLALTTTLVVAPLLLRGLPALPASPTGLTLLVLGETVVGLFLGATTRMFMAALATAGMIIASTTSLANALVTDPSAAQQGSIAGSFLTVVALTAIFALDLHHLMFRALVASYEVFPPGQALPVGAFSETVARTMAETFRLSFHIAAPFIAVGMIFYLGIGLLARLMPQVQIFFIAIPLQISLGLVVFSISLPFAIRWFLAALDHRLAELAGLGGT